MIKDQIAYNTIVIIHVLMIKGSEICVLIYRLFSKAGCAGYNGTNTIAKEINQLY
jgi:hypothetical protein